MIVVVGVPAWRAADPAAPAGRACEVAIAAAQRGARVELVGRTGDDPAGDQLLLALTQAGVGHVAMLRDPARATPIIEAEAEGDVESAVEGDVELDVEPGAGLPDGPGRAADAETGAATATGMPAPDRTPVLEPADVSLGLGYLTAFGVLVVTDDVPEAVIPASIEAAAFTGAHLVLLVPAGGIAPGSLPGASTVLAAPIGNDGAAFAALVAAYAASLDVGVAPADAFAAATGDSGWEPLHP